MLWFMVVVLLLTPRGEYVTVAKEVESREQCEDFSDEVRGRFPAMYIQTTCKRYRIDAQRSGKTE